MFLCLFALFEMILFCYVQTRQHNVGFFTGHRKESCTTWIYKEFVEPGSLFEYKHERRSFFHR